VPSPSGPASVIRRRFAASQVELKRGDLTAQHDVDAIVNAANGDLLPGGGVCGAIASAAGPTVFEECARLRAARGPLPAGEAVITGAGRLRCRYVIHAVGPVWSGGSGSEARALASCYRESLALAAGGGLRSIAFPSIATGIYGYPVAEAAAVALVTVVSILTAGSPVELVRFVLFGDADLAAYRTELERVAAS
jgi:O-acetyl-ADP-ribose deacetylase